MNYTIISNNFKQFLFIVVNLFHRQKSNLQGVSNFTEGFNRKTFVETPSIVFLMSGKPASVNPSKDPLFSFCCQEVIMQFSSIKALTRGNSSDADSKKYVCFASASLPNL